MKAISECRLYGFVDTAYLRGRAPGVVAQYLCDGGADLIQVRAKNSTADEICQLAQTVRAVTQKAGVGLVINDHPAVARAIGADLCHLGQEDFFGAGYTRVSQLRTSHPTRDTMRENFQSLSDSVPRIGLSTHGPEQAQRALAAGADYIAIGPVYRTRTKPQAQPVTLKYVRWAAANLKTPWFAIGGITLENLGELLAAGATRICVVSAILNAKDVTAACRAFRARLG